MNNATLIGNLVRNPELRTTQGGLTVCTFTIAVNRKQEADFFRVTAWGKLAENCNRYLTKGSKVGVIGAVSLNTYEGKDGKTRSSIEINASEVEFLTKRSDADDTGLSYTPPEGFTPVADDDLPF